MSQPRDPYGAQRPQYQPYPPQYRQQYPVQPQQYPPRRPAAPYQPPAPPPPASPRRLPGLGLVLTAVGFVIQVLSLTVLPWVASANEFGTHGFGGWYLVLFSYPLAALGIVLALATVLDSVVLKVIWGGLTLVGLGVLVLRFGFGPFAEVVTGDGGLEFSRQEITTAVIAVAALVGVIFVLRTALSMFRRVAGLILLGLAGVHVAAVLDLAKGSATELGIGAFGPAAGYVLVAIAAFVGPRRLPGV